jgi:hypothetical protein
MSSYEIIGRPLGGPFPPSDVAIGEVVDADLTDEEVEELTAAKVIRPVAAAAAKSEAKEAPSARRTPATKK